MVAGQDNVLADLVRPSLDRGSPVPLYFQLSQTLERLIESGVLAVGARLSNEADLARELAVSRPTVRRALGYLAENGSVLRLRGMGTVVMPVPIRRSVALTSLYDDLQTTGHKPTTRVREITTVLPPAEVATGLNLSPNAKVVYIRRLRLADDAPLAVMENYLPNDLLKLTQAQLEQTGLYHAFQLAGIVPRVASQSIGARAATADEALLLAMDEGDPILQLKRISYDETGRAIEYAAHAYAAARHSFHMNLVSELRAAQP